MGIWDELWSRIQDFFGGEQPDAGPEEGDGLQILEPRVLLITFDPIIQSRGQRKLSQVLGWQDVDALCREYIADLGECSRGFVQYQIVQRIEVDAWPVKVDGFRYDEDGFLERWQTRTGWHDPDAVDYERIIADFDLLARVESGQCGLVPVRAARCVS